MRGSLVRCGLAIALVASLLAIGATVGPAEPAGAAANPWSHTIVNGFSTPTGGGYWLIYADGTVEAHGDGEHYGDASGLALNGPMVGGAVTPSGMGYWLVAQDGGIFSYGDAAFYGSMGGMPLNQPVFSMTPTKSGEGYWSVAFDGGIFSFGDAVFYGSTGDLTLNQPINGITTSPSGEGYRMAARDGGIFSFGDVPFYGSLPGEGLMVTDVVGMAPTPTDQGYWIARSGGQVHAFGNADDLDGYTAPADDPVAAIFSSPIRQGYRLVLASGKTVPFGAAPGEPESSIGAYCDKSAELIVVRGPVYSPPWTETPAEVEASLAESTVLNEELLALVPEEIEEVSMDHYYNFNVPFDELTEAKGWNPLAAIISPEGQALIHDPEIQAGQQELGAYHGEHCPDL